jgi:diguanylate cyclase (GGDEF)-like protein
MRLSGHSSIDPGPPNEAPPHPGTLLGEGNVKFSRWARVGPDSYSHMSEPGFTVLCIGAPAAAAAWQSSPLGPFTITQSARLDSAHLHDAVLIGVAGAGGLSALERRAGLVQAAFDSALVVVIAPAAGGELSSIVALLRAGVQDVVAADDDVAIARALRHAIERKRLERAARNAYATDLATGLPHQAQLLEHMNHLLALRERAPAPMVLIVLHLLGFEATAARIGDEAAKVLRRKVAVRLRGGLRASDVVASIGPDAFGILLGHVEALGHGERVVAKLVRSMQQPFQVAGQPCAVAVTVGMALYPEHGKDAGSLLQRATAQAMSLASGGPAGSAARVVSRGAAPAANDDTAT